MRLPVVVSRALLAPLLWALLASSPGRRASAATPGDAPMRRLLSSHDWAGASARAAGVADPLASTLVAYIRLLSPGGGGAGEIAGFIAQHPQWPDQAGLRQRRDEALSAEAQAALGTPETAALPAASAALRAVAAASLRRAWIDGFTSPDAERRAAAWSPMLDPPSQTARFERLVWVDAAAALRQVGRLSGQERAAALAWAALRQDAPQAAALLASLGPARRAAYLQLEQASSLRRTGGDAAALACWREITKASEASHPDAFWAERERLAWRLLAAGSNAEALWLIETGQPQAAASQGEQAETAGWILLRRLGRPAEALAWFDRLLALSHSSIGLGAAHYWRGRALAVLGETAQASAEYRLAATWPTSLPGQPARRWPWPRTSSRARPSASSPGTNRRVRAASCSAWASRPAPPCARP